MLDWKTLKICVPLAAVLLTACDDEQSPPPDPELVAEGERLYTDPVEGGNTFACATCHAMDDAEGRRRAGHPLGGATARASFKNGQLDAFEDAANSCLMEWMNADPWSENDPRWESLTAYIESGSGAEDEIDFQIVDPPTDLSGGDIDAGRSLFNASCAECHGDDGEGTLRAIAVSDGDLEPSYIARRVRSSGAPGSPIYDGLTGGIMPFWSAERLSDDELGDLVAYLSRNYTDDPDDPADPDDPDDPSDPDDPADPSDPDDPDDPADPTDPDDPIDPTGCTTNHPKVGQTAQLQNFFHDVGGTAEIIDDCTIEITGFTFDGEGIDVQMYGGFEGMYDNGFSMSENLVRTEPYLGETIRFTLPEGRTMDDVGGVSVWCVPVGADFGSGTFG